MPRFYSATGFLNITLQNMSTSWFQFEYALFPFPYLGHPVTGFLYIHRPRSCAEAYESMRIEAHRAVQSIAAKTSTAARRSDGIARQAHSVQSTGGAAGGGGGGRKHLGVEMYFV